MPPLGAQVIVATYIGPEHGKPWKKDQIVELQVVDMSVFDNTNACWYTYDSLQQFFRHWIVTGTRGMVDA